MSTEIKCPHCSKLIDFALLAKQNKPSGVTRMQVYAGVIFRGIPDLMMERLGYPESTGEHGREFTITLASLQQTDAIDLTFLIERDADEDEREVKNHIIYGCGLNADGEVTGEK